MFFRGIFSTKFWFNRTSKISAVEGVRLRSNCGNKFWKQILVPGLLFHDSPTFFRADKLGQFVRSPSSQKQIPCLLTAEGRERSCGLQVQEGQELSAAAGPRQLNLKMTSEHQTVDRTNKVMGNDHDSIVVRFRRACSTGRHKL